MHDLKQLGARRVPQWLPLSRAALSDPGALRAPSKQREENEMHLHWSRLTARPAPQRPAKVIQLETRRQARLEKEHVKRLPPRPAA